MTRIILVASGLLILTACGSGGGGGGGDSESPAPETGSAALGSRAVPGGSVTVTKSGPSTAGRQSFRVTLVSDPLPTDVRTWIGTEYDPAATGMAAVPVAGSPGVYDIALSVPSPLPAQAHVWVRMVHADGSVIETGHDDFRLSN